MSGAARWSSQSWWSALSCGSAFGQERVERRIEYREAVRTARTVARPATVNAKNIERLPCAACAERLALPGVDGPNRLKKISLEGTPPNLRAKLPDGTELKDARALLRVDRLHHADVEDSRTKS